MVVQGIGLGVDLRSQNRNISDIYLVTGVNSISDGLGGMFYWNSASTSADDGVNVFQVTGVTTGRWIRVSNTLYIDGSGTLNYLPKFTPDGSTVGNSVVYNTGTSVRINTVTPHNSFNGELIVASSGNANLEVRAAANNQSAINLTQGISDSGTSPRVEIFNSGNFGIVVYKPSVVSSNYVLYYDTESASNRSLSFQTEGSDRLTINQNGTIRLNAYTTNGLVKTSSSDGTISIATAGTDYQAPISLTTTGTSGAATFVGNVLNIPQYQPAGSYVPTSRQLTINGTAYDLSQDRSWSVGTVTSVDMSVPTGLTVSGNPITSSGTLAITYTTGYAIPTTAKQSNWDDAYTWVAAFPTQTGQSGKFLTTDGSALSWADNAGGTVTDVSFTTGTSGTDVNSSVATSTTTPSITLNIPIADATNTGKLSNTDWSTFNSKQSAISLTTTGTSGAATFASNTLNIPQYQGEITLTTTGSTGAATLVSNTLNIPDYSAALSGYVPTSRQLTINGTQYDLTVDRTWTVGTVTSVSLATDSAGTDVAVSGSPVTSSGTITLSIPTASATNTGKLSAADWTTFNNKQNALTFGNLTEATSTILTITGGTGAVIGSGVTIAVAQASGSQSGYLSSTDWTTFNNKQSAITLTTTGSSGAATFVSNTLNIPNYTISGLGGVPTSRQLTINGTAYDLSADRSWSVGTVTSVGLSMPAAFTVTNSPITGSGTINVAAAGTSGQYIRGDGTLADFPGGNTGGGGASVSYYLNGSVNQGTFGGNVYHELNKTPIFGAGTDFSIAADGYITQFITDAGDPNSLLIPAGNWNFEMYFSASSGGGTPLFYIELYKYDGTSFTLIASNSASPEFIAFGTTINPYYTAIAVPETVLSLTDRLAIRVYVVVSGRTITLHTENSHLCQIVTTFTTGLQALNGLTAQVQNFATGTAGSDFNISSAVATHTFNLPVASAANTGKLSNTDWTTFNNKQNALTFGNLTEATSSVLTISGGTGAVIGSGTSIQVKQSSASVSGFLSSTDWNTFNNKITNPMTTLGDVIYGGASGAPTRLAGNTTAVKQYLSQTGTGTISSAPSWATIDGGDITGYALTKVDDTNVTLTLGGTPATALLRATSITVGWNGTLAISRGGTGASSKAAAFDALSPMTTLGDLIYGSTSGANTRLAGNTTTAKQYLSQTGNGTISAAPAWATIAGSDITGAALTKVDDTNVTLTLGGTPATALLRAASLTLGWTGLLAVSRGGTGVSTANANMVFAGPTTGAAAAPTFRTLVSDDIPSLSGLYLPLTGGTLTGALIGTSATFSGDLTVDTNTLYVDSTNNKIGIGTTAPLYTLQINNLSIAGATVPNFDGIAIRSGSYLGTTAKTGFLLQGNTGDNTSRTIWMQYVIRDGSGGALAPSSLVFSQLTQENPTVETERFRLSSTGNGIFSGSLTATNGTFTQSTIAAVIVNTTTTSSYSTFVHQENGTQKALWQYINSAFATTDRRNYLEAYNTVGGFAVYTNNTKALDINTSQAATFSGDLSVVKSGNALLRVHASTNTTPVADIELMRGTNTTWGADAYGDYRLRSSGGDLLIQYGDGGVTTTPLTIASTGAATFSTSGSASYGTINLEATDPFIRFYDTNGTVDKRKWDIRAIGATGNEALEFRTINDANTVFSTKLSISQGGNVGIGTTSPSAILHVSGSAGNQIRYSSPNVSNVLGVTGADVGIIGTVTAHDLALYTNATERMRITSGGLVGIGTSSPATPLHVAGDGTAINLFRIQHTGTGTNGIFNISVTNTDARLLASYSSTAIPMLFMTGNAERVRIDANGLLGVGTNAPTSLLHVVGSQPASVATNGTAATQVVQVTGGKGGNTSGTTGQTAGAGASLVLTGGAGGDAPAGSTNGTGGSITLNAGAAGAGAGTAGSAGALNFQTAGTNRLTIAASGAATFSSSISATSATFSGTSASSILTLANTTGGTKADFIITENTGLIIDSYESTTARSIDFRNAGVSALSISSTGAATFSSSVTATDFIANNRFIAKSGAQSNPTGAGSVVIDYQSTSDLQGRIRSRDWDGAAWKNLTIEANNIILSPSGSVGIGTTSPNDQLEIAGNTASAFRVRINNANASGGETLIFAQGTTLKSWVEYNNSTSNFDVWQYTNAALRFGTNNTERMRITSGGDVLIRGTYNPYSTTNRGVLALNGTASNILSFTDNTTAKGHVYHSGTDMQILNNVSTGALTLETNATERMRITSGGDVGIGTTSPDAIFHVAKSTSAGLGGQIVIDNPAGSAVGNAVEISFLTDSGASGAGNRNGRIRVVNEDVNNGSANMQFYTWDGGADAERLRITSGGALVVGNGQSSATPALGLIEGTDGSGTNIAGAGLRLQGGQSTGTAAGGSISFYTSAAGGTSGATLNTASERMSINSAGTVRLNAYTTNGLVYTTGSNGTLNSAARTINGTTFNGSANITTANWGTARTLTLGVSGKSVNGSANVSWSIYEMFGTVGNATTPVNTAGWYKIGLINDRGGGKITLCFTGGNYNPVTYVIYYYKNYSTEATLKLEKYGDAGYITDVRIRQDSTNSLYYIEVYGIAVPTYGLEFEVYDHRTLGYNGTATIYTGALTAGSATGTTRATAKFTSNGGVTANTLRVENAAVFSGDIDVANIFGRGNIYAGYEGSGSEYHLTVGGGRTGNGFAYIDLVGDETYTDYGLRLIRGNAGANSTSQLVHRGTGDLQINTDDAAPIVFRTSASDRMRIASNGQVNITNSNATTALAIRNTSTAASTSKSSAIYFEGTDTVGTGKNSGTIEVVPRDNNYIDADMVFYTRITDVNSEKMRINNKGIVGFRINPNTGWGTSLAALQIGTGGTIVNWTGGNSNLSVGVNFYDDGAGAQKRIYATATSKIDFNADVITLSNAASSTVGSTITWSPRMTITSGGLVNINDTTNTTYRLYVNGTLGVAGSASFIPEGLSTGGYSYMSQTVSGAMTILGHNVKANTSVANRVNVVNGSWISSMIKMYYNEGITFHTNPTTYAAGATFYDASGTTNERVRIDVNGNVGIGTSTVEALLHLSKSSAGGEGAFIFVDNPAGSTLGNKAGIRFATNSGATFSGYGSYIEAINTNAGNGAESLTFGTWDGGARGERMRIAADGNVLIGEGTSSTSRLVVRKDAAGARGGEISIVNYAASTLNSSAALNFGLEASTYDADNGNAQIKAQITNAGNSASDIIMSTWNGSAFGERFRIASAGAATFSSSVTATSFYESSDARLKTLLDKQIDYNAIAKIEPKYYMKNGKEELGYFAQDVEGLLDSAIEKRDSGYLDLAYRQLHTAKIAALEAKIKELEAKLSK